MTTFGDAASALSSGLTASSRLAVSALGIRLRTPLIVASGPITDGEERLRRAFNSGAGAVVSKTIFVERQQDMPERIAVFQAGMLNTTLYSRIPLNRWLGALRRLNEEGVVVIPNVHATTPERLGELAAQVADTGCPALELGISCPHDGGHERTQPSLVGAYVAAVRRRVRVPIAVKLGVADGLHASSVAAVGEGADALSISDTLPAILVDTKRWQLSCMNVAGYSGAGIKPLVLHAIYQLRASGVKCPIIGIGGVESADDVLQYIYAGACAVQAYTVFHRTRFERVAQINHDLDCWLLERETTIDDLTSESGRR